MFYRAENAVNWSTLMTEALAHTGFTDWLRRRTFSQEASLGADGVVFDGYDASFSPGVRLMRNL